ncbi:MAG: hypothetical protein V7K21_18685 [Nostoc sp.]|uniref:hypothetical protein n=1 Tax=Nostoc sp. TaxID=1180 RepID=UPI002FFC7BA2
MINYYGLLILVWIGYIASLLVTLESQFNATPLNGANFLPTEVAPQRGKYAHGWLPLNAT